MAHNMVGITIPTVKWWN